MLFSVEDVTLNIYHCMVLGCVLSKSCSIVLNFHLFYSFPQ